MLMTPDELQQLYALLTKWIADPLWNRGSDGFATIVEARRQVELDMRDQGIEPPEC